MSDKKPTKEAMELAQRFRDPDWTTREIALAIDAHAAAKDATIADLREKLRVVGEALKQCEWGGTERDEDGAELEACPWCGEPKPEGITPDPLNGHFQECELFTALRAAGVGGEQK